MEIEDYEIEDYIVVGSGFCGVIAAKTLIDKGVKVMMLDAGIAEPNTQPIESNFIDFRLTAPEQTTTFLGNNFEVLANLWGKNPLHLTPNRQFVIAYLQEWLSWLMGDFSPVESLAAGGLGNAWGLGAFVYSNQELQAVGLPVTEMQVAYQWLSKIIAISGGNEANAKYANGYLFEPQKAIPLDFNGDKLWAEASHKRQYLAQKSFAVGRTPLAISTENDLNGEAYKEDDWDFYTTQPSSAYRPIATLHNLKQNHNFRYLAKQLVYKFAEKTGYIEIETIDIDNKERKKFYCKKLLLCAGTLGTARIVMRSLSINTLPLICNPYHTIVSFQPQLLGASNIGYQTGLSQLSLYYDTDNTDTHIAVGSVYSYRALMAFRLLKEMPWGVKNNLAFLKILQPALNLTGLFLPEYGSENKYITREKNTNSLTNDSLKSYYQFTEKEIASSTKTKQAFKKVLCSLGSIPLKVHNNPMGASIHYGGTLPFTQNGQSGFVQSNGLLKGCQNVYIADGSVFNFLSGKGLTFTLMAYAHTIAKNVLRNS